MINQLWPARNKFLFLVPNLWTVRWPSVSNQVRNDKRQITLLIV